MGKFDKTLGKIPVSRKRFEGATGTSLPKEDLQSKLQSEYDNETDEDKKKKIKQRAHFQGVALN